MALGLSALMIVIAFAAYVGLLGAPAQILLQQLWAPGSNFYQENKAATDWTLAALGLVVSAASATFAVFKSWHYAERNLPKRIEAFIHERRHAFLNTKPALVRALRASAVDEHFLSPTTAKLRLNEALKAVGLASEARLSQVLANSSDTISNQISVLDARKSELASQAATAHVLRGLHFAAQAANRADTTSQRTYHECALQEFEKALTRQADDLDCLELAASQCATMGKEPAAIDYYLRLIQSANARNRKTVQARALRLLAAILERQPAPKSWNDARGKLETAIGILSEDQGAGQEFDPKAEITESLLLLGQVQTKRERYSAAHKALVGARTSASVVPMPPQKDIQQRIDEAFIRLDQAAKDPETPDIDAAFEASEAPDPTKSATDPEHNSAGG